MEIKVYLKGNYESGFFNRLKTALNRSIVLYDSDSLPDPPDYEILICGVPNEKDIKASSHLRRLIIPWAGLPKATGELMEKYPDITIHNIHHNAVPAAETAVMLMLSTARKLIPIDRELRRNNWTPRYDENDILLLEGKTALILGYGAIGRKIDKMICGFGMKIIAVGNSVRKIDGKEVHPVAELNRLLPRAQVLIVALPLTDKTKSMIGHRELKLLPDNAIVINIARGAIINEQALYDELKLGRIRAGLDVWYNYPKEKSDRSNTAPSDFPFNELDNVVMSPHMGGHSDKTEELRADELARLLNIYSNGGELPNRVSLEKGY